MQKRALLLEMPIKIQFYDIDAMGIVSNIVYIRWFEDLRMKFLETHLSIQDLMKQGLSPILRETQIDYKRPLTIFDQPVGYIWVADLEHARWNIELEIVCNKRVYCKGNQKGYFVSLDSKRPVEIPEKLRTIYEKELGII